MRTFTAIVERDADTHLYVGYVPGFLIAHSQGETLDELQANLQEVVEILARRSANCVEHRVYGHSTDWGRLKAIGIAIFLGVTASFLTNAGADLLSWS